MPFVEVLGNAGTVPPAQIERLVPNAKAGGILGSTETVNVAGVAQSPAVGVNV